MTQNFKIQHQKRTKRQHSALLTMGENIPPYPVAAVNTMGVNGQQFTQSQKTAHTPTYTQILNGKLSNLTEQEKENALLTAGAFRSTLPHLLTLGILKRGRDTQGNIVLMLPSTLWDDDMRLREQR